jgi:protein-S-isoprenylcysteine O-methyltransferase Ste14
VVTGQAGPGETCSIREQLMQDVPVYILTVTIWAYWIGAGIMVVRVRKMICRLPGVVPEQRLERLMWLIWIPLVILWLVLPFLAITQRHGLLAVPEPVLTHSGLVMLRWAASLVGVVCLLVTIDCWVRMGKNWRMGVVPDQTTELVTDGLYSRIRHPIYAFSVLFMLCSVAVIPTIPMAAVATIHTALMILKAHNEERFLLQTYGKRYADYCRRTGRFFPRLVLRR